MRNVRLLTTIIFLLLYRADNTWVVGSGDVTLHLTVLNSNETAFRTRVTIEMPIGVKLRRTINECEESATGNIVTLYCKIEDPIRRGKTVNYFSPFSTTRYSGIILNAKCICV